MQHLLLTHPPWLYFFLLYCGVLVVGLIYASLGLPSKPGRLGEPPTKVRKQSTKRQRKNTATASATAPEARRSLGPGDSVRNAQVWPASGAGADRANPRSNFKPSL
jgi:hypothetical protein